MPEVSPFICGAAVGDGPLFPGDTTRLTLAVDEDICDDSAVFSLVSMLSESAFRLSVSVAHLYRRVFSFLYRADKQGW